MIKFVNVSQYYGKFQALFNIDFEVAEGTLLALLGPNGAGKSTTMSIMTGFRPPVEGDVFINGINIFEEPEKAKSHIGYLPEIPPLYPDLTVSEYLSFAADLREAPHSRIKEVLQLLKLEDRENALIKNLSKGLKQRVGIAQSILHKPKILVLDEPTVGLEPSQLIEFRQLIKNLAKEENMTVVISTHIMAEAAELCDEIIIISAGRKLFEGKKDKLLENKDKWICELKVNEPSPELHKKLLSLKHVEGVEDIDGGFIITATEDVSQKIAEKALHYGIKSINPVLNSLEKVFLELTSEEK